MVTPQTLDKIYNEIILSGRDTRYKIGAYNFVLQGLNYYYTKTGEKRHFSGKELSKGFIDFALKQFGPLTNSVLDYWGINSTNDLGYIVYNLIEIRLIQKKADDKLEDFFNVLNINEYLNTKEYYNIDKNFIQSVKGV